MQQAPFICRACLSRLRQPWRSQPTTRRLLSQTSTDIPLRAVAEDAIKGQRISQPPRQRGGSAKNVRRSEPHSSFRKYIPQGEDRAHIVSQESNTPASDALPTNSATHFDDANYSPEDSVFWNKFEELWNDPGAEAPRAESIQHDLTRVLRPVYTNGTSRTLPAELRVQRKPQWKFSSEHVLKSQWLYLKHTCAPEDLPAATARFRKWKKHMTTAWKRMLVKRDTKGPKGIRRLEWLVAQGNVDAMRAAWAGLPAETRGRVWPHILLSAIQARPQDVCNILEATFDPELIPSYAVQDVIHFMIRRERATLPQSGPSLTSTEEICRVVELLFANSPQDYLRLRQRTLYLLISDLKPHQLAQFHKRLVRSKHPLHAMTKLQIAGRLAKDAAFKEYSMAMLKSLLRTRSIDINTPHGASLCTSILSMDEKDLEGGDDAESDTPARLFEHLLQLGLNPNLITYTIIIRNLCLAKQLDTAWEVYQVMLDHKIEPDVHVFSTLMNGSKLAQNHESLRHVVELAAARDVRDPIFWNDLLHGVFLSALIEARRKRLKPPRVVPSFPLMLQFYARIFDVEPLKPLLLLDVEQFLHSNWDQSGLASWNFVSELTPIVRDLPPLESGLRIEPTTSTLASMLIAYVRGISKPYDIIAFYAHFRKLLQSGNPSATRLVAEQGTLVHDIVIKALCEYQGMLRVALDVVSDMLRDASAAASAPASAPATATATQHPAPSVHTWSILLNGFMFQRQRQQGERILALMRQHGAQPNVVTWNTLAAGYARMQDVGKTVRAMQRLEAAGFEADEFTFRAFSYLQNKAAALSQMEGMVQHQRRKRMLQEARVGAQGHGGDELSKLESEVEEIARMMEDEDQGEGGEDGDGFDYEAEERAV